MPSRCSAWSSDWLGYHPCWSAVRECQNANLELRQLSFSDITLRCDRHRWLEQGTAEKRTPQKKKCNGDQPSFQRKEKMTEVKVHCYQPGRRNLDRMILLLASTADSYPWADPARRPSTLHSLDQIANPTRKRPSLPCTFATPPKLSPFYNVLLPTASSTW